MRGLRFLPLLLAACAAPPSVEEPAQSVDIPRAWTAGAAAPGRPEAGWWRSFGDPRLDALVREAVEKNPGLRGASARVDAALAQARIAGADSLPQAAARFDAGRRKQVFLGIEIPGIDVLSPTFTSFGVSLDLSWEIDLWGRLRARESAALSDVQAAEADFEGAQLSLAAQTAKAYFASVEARRQTALARATLESYRSVAERIRDRALRGLRPLLDLRLAEANVASAESALRQREELEDRVLRQLEVLAGRYPAARVELAVELPALPGAAPAGLPSELLRRRPDLAAAERRQAAGGARVDEAYAALFPRLALTASGGSSTSELKDLVDADFLIWSVAANLAAPLFQGGRLRAALDLSRAVRDQAAAAYAQGVLQAFSDVESALASEAILRERVRSAREFAVASAEAAAISEQRYLAGLLDIVTLLEAQRRAFLSEIERLSVERQLLDARVNLHLALGGGFERKS
jgi:NodT family efflux transporter outer membrane factor (OMF) lipoprotein